MNTTKRLGVLGSLALVLVFASTGFAQFKVDHFKVYDVKDVRVQAGIATRGQFDKEPVRTEVRALTMFANPVNKDGREILDKNAHLAWYAVKRAQEEPKRTVEIENQFGGQKLVIGQPMFLLTPALKRERGAEFPERLDHYLAYEVLEGRPIAKTVSLRDQFESQEQVGVGRPRFFCLPVAKEHEGKLHPIKNERDHLTVYEIRPKESPREIAIEDQFGRKEATVLSSALLCVPTHKERVPEPNGNGEPPPGDGFKLDHIKFYIVERVPVEHKVALRGQFDREPKDAVLVTLSHLGTPTRKNREEVKDRNSHFTMYQLKQEQEEPVRSVKLRNQFGEQAIRIGNPVALLAPAEKVEQGSQFPKTLDHYKCYEVLEGNPIDKAVVLRDQFGPQHEVKVNRPRFFCVPVAKRFEGEAQRIQNEKEHMLIYNISPTPDTGMKKDVVDQFGKRTLRILRGVHLGVPSLKLGFDEQSATAKPKPADREKPSKKPLPSDKPRPTDKPSDKPPPSEKPRPSDKPSDKPRPSDNPESAD